MRIGDFYLKSMEKEFPKCPICDSTNGYEFSGIIGTRYAQCRTCKTKWKLMTKKGGISELTVHELPKDGNAVHTITSTKKPLFTVIGTRLPTDFWKNLEVEKEINWKFLSRNVSSDVSKAVFTEKGEKLLHQLEGIREGSEVTVTFGRTYQTTKSESGILLLSTRKLRWVTKRANAFMSAYEIPLEDIRGISGDTGDSTDWGLLRRVTLVDSRGENTFRLKYAFLELFEPLIRNAMTIRKEEIEAEKKKERLHVVLDFSFLKTYMKKGGIVMQVLKCPHCSGKIEFPKSGTQTKCSYCGNTIYAQDIFEKVKSLLE